MELNETLAILTNGGRESESDFPGKGRLPDHNQSPSAAKRWKQLRVSVSTACSGFYDGPPRAHRMACNILISLK